MWCVFFFFEQKAAEVILRGLEFSSVLFPSGSIQRDEENQKKKKKKERKEKKKNGHKEPARERRRRERTSERERSEQIKRAREREREEEGGRERDTSTHSERKCERTVEGVWEGREKGDIPSADCSSIPHACYSRRRSEERRVGKECRAWGSQ